MFEALLAWLEHDETFVPASLPSSPKTPTSDGAGPKLGLQGVPIGAAVEHAKFGLGRVRAVRAGDEPRLVIDFEEGARRTLPLRLVELA